MRIRQIIPHLKAAKLIEDGLIPNFTTWVSAEVMNREVTYPDWVYKAKRYADMGLILEAWVNVCLPISSCKDEGILSLRTKELTTAEKMKRLMKSMKLESWIDESTIILADKIEQWVAKDVYLSFPYASGVELNVGPVQGHPDLINERIVLEVKCCLKLATNFNSHMIQVLSYVALARSLKYPATHIGLVLPLHQQVLSFDVTKWDSSRLLILLHQLAKLNLSNPINSSIILRQILILQFGIGHHIGIDILSEDTDKSMPYQIYTGGQMGRSPIFSKGMVDPSNPRVILWKKMIDSGHQIFIHAPLNVNVCNSKTKLNLVVNDLQLGKYAGFKGVVLHVGKHLGKDIHLAQMFSSLDYLVGLASPSCPLLLETPAGQGTETGVSIEQLAHIYSRYRNDSRFGICVDTAHVWGAGYNPLDYLKKWLSYYPGSVKLIHFNDSKVECGSKVDRHEHYGKGKIGFEILTQVAMLAVENKIPMVIE